MLFIFLLVGDLSGYQLSYSSREEAKTPQDKQKTIRTFEI
jgi:hypothetical protein